MIKFPNLLLQRLYTFGSLEAVGEGTRFNLKNRLTDASVTSITRIAIDDREVDLAGVTLTVDGTRLAATAVGPQAPLAFPLRKTIVIDAPITLAPGKHTLRIAFVTDGLGDLTFTADDTLATGTAAAARATLPYDKEENQHPEIIKRRQAFVAEQTGAGVTHIGHYSIDPETTKGNIENFTGVAQIPIGMAGPLLVNGEHATGEFYIPMATTEGTLVASYNRGMKVLNLSGGCTCTVVDDAMQRAPVFVFDSAREARDFRAWINAHLKEIADAAEATSRIAKLLYIDTYLVNKFAFLRFNFSTGDAAGQNMVGRATFAACSWILEQITTVRKFYLESNFATDKKASQINIMRTRGKRVTAECVVPRTVLMDVMRVEPESLAYHSHLATIGAFFSGANNNGAHSPNGITAVFIATGQDVANVAESSAGILYTEITESRDLYISLTIPSLIVATHGGGTGLATQRECLEILGCTGRGSVNKLAEIIAGVALAGELSLGAAISSLDWVSSHEKYGRNR